MHSFANPEFSIDVSCQRTIADMLARFPTISVERLRRINEAATSSRHVLLALGYGTIDPHIGKLNQLIVRLLVSRLRAENAGDKLLIERIERKLKELHQAIDQITHTRMSNVGPVCASVSKRTNRHSAN